MGEAVGTCIEAIHCIRDGIDELCKKYRAETRSFRADTNRAAAKEACDLIVNQLQDRFSNTEYVQAFRLIDPTFFSSFRATFPDESLNIACTNYAMLSKERLKTELKVLYTNQIFAPLSTTVELHSFFLENNLRETFSEVFKLLQVAMTTPVSSAEAERCFSTLKRIKTWLRNAMGHSRLNALAMLTIHAELVNSLESFHDRVIDKFARLKNRRMNFLYKN